MPRPVRIGRLAVASRPEATCAPLATPRADAPPPRRVPDAAPGAPHALDEPQKRRHAPRVELRATAASQLEHGAPEGQRAAIGPSGGHGVVGVDDRHDPRLQWDLVPAEPVGEATAIETLVVPADGGEDARV